jgi:hypothetical protein
MSPVVDGYFRVLREDLEAARRLTEGVPRASAFHLQQAAEKLVKALLAAERIHVGTAHDWKADLAELDYLSRFATAYRHPSPSGRIAPPPERAVLDQFTTLIKTLADEAEGWCGTRNS